VLLALAHDGVELVPLQQPDFGQRRVEVEVAQAARFGLARGAVEDRDVEQVRHQRGQAVAAAGARAQAVEQQRPGAGDFVEGQAARAARAQVHADDAPHAALLAHHVDREVVEGAAHAVDLDAAALQLFPDAQMRQPARAAAGQHQPGGLVAEDARQPLHVALEGGAQVDVAVDRAPIEPAPHTERAFELGRVQQQQGLVGCAQLQRFDQAGLFDRVDVRRFAGLGQQQDFVGVARAQAAPAFVGDIGLQEHEIVPGFELVEHQRAGGVAGRTVLLQRLGAGFGGADASHAAVFG